MFPGTLIAQVSLCFPFHLWPVTNFCPINHIDNLRFIHYTVLTVQRGDRIAATLHHADIEKNISRISRVRMKIRESRDSPSIRLVHSSQKNVCKSACTIFARKIVNNHTWILHEFSTKFNFVFETSSDTSISDLF